MICVVMPHCIGLLLHWHERERGDEDIIRLGQSAGMLFPLRIGLG